MPSADLLKESERVMVICNACRYCEGFCAVFPAMELRRVFSDQDLIYLANLCHNCRGCYYACPYAPPHEFAVNVPKMFAELRAETYQDFTWPNFLARLFKRNGLAVALIMVVSVLIVSLPMLLLQDPAVVFSTHVGAGAFHAVIPYGPMVIPAIAVSVWALAALSVGFFRFWRATGGSLGGLTNVPALAGGTWDALRLKYLDGGGHGCNYPDERFSQVRRWFHHLVFYGFMLSFASTTVAAIYHRFLHWEAPYPYLSLPVVLGTVGGIGLLVGTAGLLWLKGKMDRRPANPDAFGMDIGFLVLLFLTSLTGLLLLVLRATPAMGMLLAVHLGVVLGLFFTLPYGKFVHAAYRFAALIRYAYERSHERSATKGVVERPLSARCSPFASPDRRFNQADDAPGESI